MKPKLSFVIPAYNEEHYLPRCLDVLIERVRESGVLCEIIVVNNASTDATRRLASSYREVKLVDEPRKGLAAARAAGFAASTGELIANIDADTLVPVGWIDTVVKSFSCAPTLIALSGPHVLYDVPRVINYWAKIFYVASYLVYLLNRFVFRTSSLIQGGNFIIRRQALEAIGGFDSRFSFYGEDADLARRLHGVGDVRFTFALPIYASGRRVMVQGKFTTAFRYFINYVWVVLWGKPLTNFAEDIRIVPQPEHEK